MIFIFSGIFDGVEVVSGTTGQNYFFLLIVNYSID